VHRISRAADRDQLLGFEGNAAKIYFEAFSDLLKIATGFELTGRNRRPPTDPVNALLSFGYAMLVREAIAAVYEVGLEPGIGIYHRIVAGRPAMALDLMEEFRPLVVDSTVLTAINTRELRAPHFDRRGRAIVLLMKVAVCTSARSNVGCRQKCSIRTSATRLRIAAPSVYKPASLHAQFKVTLKSIPPLQRGERASRVPALLRYNGTEAPSTYA